MKKVILSVVVLTVLCGSTALALAPMGPPTAGLKKGQFSAGADYSYSRMNLKLHGGKASWIDYNPDGTIGEVGSEKLPSVTIKHAKVNTVLAKLGYGINDNWEAYLSLGGANADYKMEGDKFNGDTGFAIGFGTKATLYEQSPELKWGGLFQMGWARSDDAKASGVDEEGDTYTSSVDTHIREIQIAVGPTYKLMEKVLLYGGPFFHFVDGDVDAKGSWTEPGGDYGTDKFSYDIRQASYFGGYIGAQINVTENLPFYVEWQHTATADALAMGLVWRF